MIASPLIRPILMPHLSNTFVISGHGAALRNNFSGVVGFRFVANVNMTVTDLGRLVISGNTATHTIYLEDISGNIITSALVDVSTGTVGTYNFTSISPVGLTSGNTYHLVSGEPQLNTGDLWYGDDAPVTTTSDATITVSAYATSAGISLSTNQLGSYSYVPPNFKYIIS